ncbi:hypothetical protein [Gloeocapsa sp. PCC 7428]|uniref:hypothetical protein n=1 Tax=Gloeocapsa sp. PCC 7428 TaxID=1173026 RepID=UPI0012DCBC6C|nr:hypothetical protein [Gloeocapsa sp. PCC 7428]
MPSRSPYRVTTDVGDRLINNIQIILSSIIYTPRAYKQNIQAIPQEDLQYKDEAQRWQKLFTTSIEELSSFRCHTLLGYSKLRDALYGL